MVIVVRRFLVVLVVEFPFSNSLFFLQVTVYSFFSTLLLDGEEKLCPFVLQRRLKFAEHVFFWVTKLGRD